MNSSELASTKDASCKGGGKRSNTLVWGATLLLLSVIPAQSQEVQCTFSMSNLSFGTIDVSAGQPFDATATFTYTCTGDSRSVVRICPSWDIGDVGSMQDSSGHKLMFNPLLRPEPHIAPYPDLKDEGLRRSAGSSERRMEITYVDGLEVRYSITSK